MRFTNQDPFDHHVRSQVAGPLGNVAAAKDFGFRMAGAKAGESVTADVQFAQDAILRSTPRAPGGHIRATTFKQRGNPGGVGEVH